MSHRFRCEINGEFKGYIKANDCCTAMAFAAAGFDRDKYNRGVTLELKMEAGVLSTTTEDGRFIKLTNA